MVKIYSVDFKKKKLDFVFEIDEAKREQTLREITTLFREVMPKIKALSKDDEFSRYCSTALGGIISNLKDVN